MRELTDHIVNAFNEKLKILVVDEPGQGGANHDYRVVTSNGDELAKISFQNGPIKEFGVNGITQEVLLAIVADRLRGFQSGQYSTKENAVALTHVETAQMWLQKRTRDRILRGVEGTSIK